MQTRTSTVALYIIVTWRARRHLYSGFQLRSNFRRLRELRGTARVCVRVYVRDRAQYSSAGYSNSRMSAEPARKKAYSTDLRWRIVYQRLGMELPFYKIAKNLNIASSTAHRAYKIFEADGDVHTVKQGPRPEMRALDEHCELLIIGLILEHPTLYLDEIVQEVNDLTSIVVSLATICRLLKRYGITRKKVRQVAAQRCSILRGAFMAQRTLFKRDMFVWIDETGSDARDHIRKFGYALRGMTPTSHRLFARGQRVNAIAALASSGILALDLVTGTVSDFLRMTLIPNMMPFNGTNPHSIIIMDNCSVHHIAEVRYLLDQVGILVLYLPHIVQT